jgi:hypothetical protein
MKMRVLLVLFLTTIVGVAVAQTARPEAANAYYAVSTSSGIDIVTQINALTSTCGANCVIHVPAGKFTTQSAVPIVLHAGQSLIGDGEQLTSISGNVAKMIVWHAANNAEFYPPAGKISELSIHCGAATVECIDMGDLTQVHLESLVVDGAYNGDCIAITNLNHWFERSSFINVTVGSPGAGTAVCGIGIHLRKPAGGTNSYGYAYWPSIYQNSSTTGIQIDSGDLLYNASYIGVQSNQTAGYALSVAGVVQASFLSLTGEGPGGGIHVLKGGAVQGCGSMSSELHDNRVDYPDNDTHMPLDLTSCGFGSQSTIGSFLGGSGITFTPQILHHSSTGEVNAGLFFTDDSNRLGGPALMFTAGSHFSIGSKQLYDPIGTYHAAWWMDQVGNTTQGGSLGIGACTAPGANTGNNAVTMRVCAQNAARSELYSNISNANSHMWGTVAVRTNSGDSQYIFGAEDDAANLSAVETCTRSGATPTGCTFSPAINFAAGVTGSSAAFAKAVTGTNVKSGENVVTYSPTPVFSAAAQSNIVTLNGNLAGFTLAAGGAGQPMTLIFCQSGRGGATVAPPANVRGLGVVGTAASRCSTQSFVYSANQGAWMASGPMITNE